MTSKRDTFVPVREPPPPSPYTSDDYNDDGTLRVLRAIPDGNMLERRRATVSIGAVSTQELYAPPAEHTTPLAPGEKRFDELTSATTTETTAQAQQEKPPVSKYATAIRRQQAVKQATLSNSTAEDAPQPIDPATARLMERSKEKLQSEALDAVAHRPAAPGQRVDKLPAPPTGKLKGNKYDVATPPDMMAPHDQQYVCVFRTIENQHPDEDAILAHYYAQYVARREGTYNPIEDPPVVLSDIIPTIAVVLDRVFPKDEVEGAGFQKLESYVKRMAHKTDFDVVPARMGLPFHLPLSPEVTFKYKNKVIDQIMHEWYESHDESASDILARVEADRTGQPAEKPAWHVYDGISKGGSFAGPQTKIQAMDDPKDDLLLKQKQREMGLLTDDEDDEDEDEDDDDDDGEETKKPAAAAKTPLEKLKSRQVKRIAGGRRVRTTASRRM